MTLLVVSSLGVREPRPPGQDHPRCLGTIPAILVCDAAVLVAFLLATERRRRRERPAARAGAAVRESDGEFQRWHIDRKNALRLQRDRTAQRSLASELDSMRTKAAADLGPEPVRPAPKPAVASPVATTPGGNATPAASNPAPTVSAPIPLHQQNSGDIDTGGKPGGGGGAIDPVSGLFVLALGGVAFASYRRARGARPRAAA